MIVFSTAQQGSLAAGGTALLTFNLPQPMPPFPVGSTPPILVSVVEQNSGSSGLVAQVVQGAQGVGTFQVQVTNLAATASQSWYVTAVLFGPLGQAVAI